MITLKKISPERQEILEIYTLVINDFRMKLLKEENATQEAHNNTILFYDERLGMDIPDYYQKYF